MTSTQTVTQAALAYTGVATFTVPADGEYRLAVSGDGGQFLVGTDLGFLFGASVLWFVLVAVAVVGMLVGVVLILVGRRRLPQNVRPTPRLVVTPAASPGWYADPGASGGYLWWDGDRWHTAPVPGTPSENHPF